MIPGEQLDAEKIQNAIAINMLPEVEVSNYNVVVVSVTNDEEKEGSGKIVATDMKDNQEIVFNFSSDSNMYLTIDELKEGDKLNILTNGIATASLPPQMIIVEAKKFAE